MNWLNISQIFLASEAAEIADTLDVGVWFRLLAYCGKVENGGRVSGARLWKTPAALRIVRLTAEEIHREAAGLWKFDGDDVIVFGYPADQEEKVKANRANGKLGGRPAGGKKPPGKPPGKPHGKGNLRKSKEITTTTAAIRINPDDVDEYGPAPNSDHPEPDPLWSDFVEHREPFERFDNFKNRHDAGDTPQRN